MCIMGEDHGSLRILCIHKNLNIIWSCIYTYEKYLINLWIYNNSAKPL